MNTDSQHPADPHQGPVTWTGTGSSGQTSFTISLSSPTADASPATEVEAQAYFDEGLSCFNHAQTLIGAGKLIEQHEALRKAATAFGKAATCRNERESKAACFRLAGGCWHELAAMLTGENERLKRIAVLRDAATAFGNAAARWKDSTKQAECFNYEGDSCRKLGAILTGEDERAGKRAALRGAATAFGNAAERWNDPWKRPACYQNEGVNWREYAAMLNGEGERGERKAALRGAATAFGNAAEHWKDSENQAGCFSDAGLNWREFAAMLTGEDERVDRKAALRGAATAFDQAAERWKDPGNQAACLQTAGVCWHEFAAMLTGANEREEKKAALRAAANLCGQAVKHGNDAENRVVLVHSQGYCCYELAEMLAGEHEREEKKAVLRAAVAAKKEEADLITNIESKAEAFHNLGICCDKLAPLLTEESEHPEKMRVLRAAATSCRKATKLFTDNERKGCSFHTQGFCLGSLAMMLTDAANRPLRKRLLRASVLASGHALKLTAEKVIRGRAFHSRGFHLIHLGDMLTEESQRPVRKKLYWESFRALGKSAKLLADKHMRGETFYYRGGSLGKLRDMLPDGAECTARKKLLRAEAEDFRRATELLTDKETKGEAFRGRGNSLGVLGELLAEEGKRPASRKVFQEGAEAFGEAVSLLTDKQRKGDAFFHLGLCCGRIADLSPKEAGRSLRKRMFRQGAEAFRNAAKLLTDTERQGKTFHQLGNFLSNLANMLSDEAERSGRKEAFREGAGAFRNAAEILTDKVLQGQSFHRRGNCLGGLAGMLTEEGEVPAGKEALTDAFTAYIDAANAYPESHFLERGEAWFHAGLTRFNLGEDENPPLKQASQCFRSAIRQAKSTVERARARHELGRLRYMEHEMTAEGIEHRHAKLCEAVAHLWLSLRFRMEALGDEMIAEWAARLATACRKLVDLEKAGKESGLVPSRRGKNSNLGLLRVWQAIQRSRATRVEMVRPDAERSLGPGASAPDELEAALLACSTAERKARRIDVSEKNLVREVEDSNAADVVARLESMLEFDHEATPSDKGHTSPVNRQSSFVVPTNIAGRPDRGAVLVEFFRSASPSPLGDGKEKENLAAIVHEAGKGPPYGPPVVLPHGMKKAEQLCYQLYAAVNLISANPDLGSRDGQAETAAAESTTGMERSLVGLKERYVALRDALQDQRWAEVANLLRGAEGSFRELMTAGGKGQARKQATTEPAGSFLQAARALLQHVIDELGTLLKPVRECIQSHREWDGATLILCPTGALHQLPLAAAPWPDRAPDVEGQPSLEVRPLIEHHPVMILPTMGIADEVLRRRQRPVVRKAYLAAPEPPVLAKLPCAKEEVKAWNDALQTHGFATRVRIEQDDKAGDLWTHGSEAGIVVISGHGTRHAKFELCGIEFTDRKSYVLEMGPLVSFENCILGLQSCCWGAQPEDFKGDTPSSQALAWMAAGAASVVGSLWPQADATSHAFSTALLGGWLENEFTLAEAVQAAVLKVRHEALDRDAEEEGRMANPDPDALFRWAGYQLVGDGGRIFPRSESGAK
jgi:CHAT domain-containing protein